MGHGHETSAVAPREITSHKVNAVNDNLQVFAVDAPGPGGANHLYQIIDVSRQNQEGSGEGDRVLCEIAFQKGPIGEVGITGNTNEVLMALVEDRLKSFQAGPYACRENALALTHLQEAMMWLKRRTEERRARGVEGTMKK